MEDQSKSHIYSFAPTLSDHQKREARLAAKKNAGQTSPPSCTYLTEEDIPFFAHHPYPTRFGALTNPIHPIFAPQNFPGQEYDPLIPMLRLATRLLTSPPLLPFWHAIFFGRLDYLPELSEQYQGDICSYWRTQSVLSRKATIDTHSALEDLAEIVRFYFRFPRSKAQCGLKGLCMDQWAEGERMWRMPERYGLPGRGSIIHVSPKIVGEVRECRAALAIHARRQDGEQEWDIMEDFADAWGPMDELYDPASAQAILFDWACVLVHEIAHAAQRVGLHSGAPYEYFFEDSVVAEAGHEWEAWAFGGCTQIFEALVTIDDQRRYTRLPILTPWPEEMDKGTFTSRIPCRAKGLRNAARDQFGFAWKIDQGFVEKLFTDEFWDEEILERGREALWPERELGMRWELDCWIMERRAELEDEGDDCIADRRGLITRLPRNIDPEGFGRLLKMLLLDDL